MINPNNHSNDEIFKNDETLKSLEYEYQDHLNEDHIMQALLVLKSIAVTAKTSEQWNKFQMLIVSGLLNRMFWEKTDSQTKIWIKNICRVTGCLIGLWITNPKGQKKVKGLLDIFNKWMGEKPENKEKKLEKFSDRLSNIESIIALSKDSSLTDADRALLVEYLALSTNDWNEVLKSSVFSKWPALIEALLKDKPTSKGELEATKEFWVKVVKEIPKKKCTHDEVKFYVQKFTSWFGDKMLQDMIDWIQNKQIIWKISVSHEAEDALNAFNKFFSENLDNVLTILSEFRKGIS